MCDFLLFLKEKYPDYSFIYDYFPTYVVNIGNIVSPKTMFICKEDAACLHVINYLNSPKSKIKSKTENLDLTGSPLQDSMSNTDLEGFENDFELRQNDKHWLDIEEAYFGIPIDTARTILSECSQNVEESNLALWALCNDNTDGNSNKVCLLMIELNPSRHIRGSITYKGLTPVENLDARKLFELHSQFMPGNGQWKLECTVENFYNMSENITIKLSWNPTKEIKNLDNFNQSNVVLRQNVKLSEGDDSLVRELWHEINFLSTLRDIILEYKSKDSEATCDPVYKNKFSAELQITREELHEKIFSLLTDVPNVFEDNFPNDNVNIEMVIQMIKNREIHEVTDKLWQLLKYCSSYRDLKYAFQCIFQCATKCNIVNMPTNNNCLAKLIKELSSHKILTDICLVGSKPLELLLEIGIEKIYKDYEYIFTKCKLCSSTDISIYKRSEDLKEKFNQQSRRKLPTIRKSLYKNVASHGFVAKNTQKQTFANDSDSGDFSQKEIDFQLAKLAQIHLTLEHLLIAQIHLETDEILIPICEKMLRVIPSHFEEVKNKSNDTLEIPLVGDKIFHLLECKYPNVRRVKITSGNKFRQIENVFYYNTDSIFPPKVFDWLHIDDKNIVENEMYYSWHYLKITTIK